MTGEIEKDESPSLYVAIKAGDIEAAELLIKSGANVNDNYERNRTPLHIAIGHKQFEIARLLINNGADVNAKAENHGKDDLTPMHLAIFANTPEFIELLASNGASIDERESTEGHTPLHLAALYGNKSIMQALVDKEQSIEDIDNNGRTALFLAIRQCTEAEDNSRIEVIEYLINTLKADITKKDNNNNTILFFAANNCPGKVVKLIIKQYIESFGRDQLKDFINHKNKDGIDALDIALNSGNEKAIEVLRSYGAGIENKVTHKITAEKPISSLDEAESTKIESPIKQK